MICLEGKLNPYIVIDESRYPDLKQKLKTKLESCKYSLEETIKLDDEDENGYVPYLALDEAFKDLELDLDDELNEFMYQYLFANSESSQKINYVELIKIVDQESEIDDQVDNDSEEDEEKDEDEESYGGFEDDEFAKENEKRRAQKKPTIDESPKIESERDQ